MGGGERVRGDSAAVAVWQGGQLCREVAYGIAARRVPEDAKGLALKLAPPRLGLPGLVVLGKGDGGASLFRPRHDVDHLAENAVGGG